jgi:hypothetical protein
MPERRARREPQPFGHLFDRRMRRLEPRRRVQDPQPVDASRHRRQSRSTELVEQRAMGDTSVLSDICHMEWLRAVAGDERKRVREPSRRNPVDHRDDMARRAGLARAVNRPRDSHREIVDIPDDHGTRRYARSQR